MVVVLMVVLGGVLVVLLDLLKGGAALGVEVYRLVKGIGPEKDIA